jgi:hypothetical protein
MTRGLALYVVVGLVLAGCAKPSLIPNTKVRDTATNRELIKVVESYRRAMESRNAAGVLELVHPTYQDNAGTPEGSDDVDFEGMKRLLTTRFKRTTKIRYRIEYHDVHTRGRDAQVDTYIDATFQYEPRGSPPRWRRLTDYNRFRLLRDGDHWRFVGGL